MQPSLQATDNPLQLLEPRTPLLRHLVPLGQPLKNTVDTTVDMSMLHQHLTGRYWFMHILYCMLYKTTVKHNAIYYKNLKEERLEKMLCLIIV